jgi:hypothetical protein
MPPKKGGRLKKNMRWTTYDQTAEVGDKVNYVGVPLENRFTAQV